MKCSRESCYGRRLNIDVPFCQECVDLIGEGLERLVMQPEVKQMAINLTATIQGVTVDFGTSVVRFCLPPKDARAFATQLLLHADNAEKLLEPTG